MIDFKISPGTAGNSDIPQRFDDLPNHDIEVFQSENIQNILDAKSKNAPYVEVHYSIKKMTLKDRENLKKNLGSNFFTCLKRSFKDSEAQDIKNQAKKIQLALNNEEKWFSLIITEKNTTGLEGDETGKVKGSNYHALMRHTNKSEKKGVSGGTFGKGSSVYTYSSGLWLWFAYSVLENPFNGNKKRFAGRGMLAPFIDHSNNRSYDGPLWYSRPEDKKDLIKGHKQQGLPYIDENADKEAKKFGLDIRNKNDIGTTYFIPAFWPDWPEDTEQKMNGQTIFESLKTEILKRWFVPIYNDELRCSITLEEEGLKEKLVKENLYNIPELTYKLEILDWYYAGGDEKNKKFKRSQIEIPIPQLNSDQQEIIKEKYGKKLAHKKRKIEMDLVVRSLLPEEKDFIGFTDEEERGTVNRVALVRNKGMVINHYPYDSRKNYFIEALDDKRFEAILFAGKTNILDQTEDIKNHLELFLSYAENPAHNEWIHKKSDLHRCNLRRFEGLRPTPPGVVNMLFSGIDTRIAQFFPKDDKPPVKKEICSFWKKLYQLPTAGSSNSSEKSGFRYETLESSFDEEGRFVWCFLFRSVLEEKTIEIDLIPYLRSLETPLRKKEDFEELGVPQFNELIVYVGEKEEKNIFLSPKEEKKITIKTCKILGNNFFKNLDPVLEIKDKII